MGENIKLVDNEIIETRMTKGIPFFYGVEPAHHSLPASGSPELEFRKLSSKRMVFWINPSQEEMRSNLGVVCLAATDYVNVLGWDASGKKKLRSRCV